MKELLHLKKYFFKYKYPLLLGVLFIFISNIFSLVIPQYIGKSFDEIVEKLNNNNGLSTDGFKTMLLNYGGIILLASVGKGFFTFLMRQTVNVTSRKIEFDLKNEIFNHYQALDISFYIKNKTGDILNRISEDVSKVRMFLGPAVMYSINLFIMICLVMYRMLEISPKLTMYTVLPMPILALTIFYVSNKIHSKSLAVQQALSVVSNISQETFSGIRFIKSYALENVVSSQNTEASNTYKNEKLSLIKTQSLFFPLMILLIGLSNLTVIYFGGKAAINGEMTLGKIPEFIVYVNMLTWPVASIGWVSALTYTAAASQKRINEFLQTEPKIKNKSSEKTTIDNDISLEDVSFTYPESGVKAIKNLTLNIKKGETIGVIGKTGSGKTTLAKLLCRLYDINSGTITINNLSIDKHNLYSLRESIAYVSQDVFLFSDTIANNLKFGVDHVSEEQMINAAKNASIYSNIIDFKNAFETEIGERGISLSGGQKQRLSIARALLKNPDLLILDDCLSAVDTETEHQIVTHLKSWMANRTSVFISHRISTVQHADKILVLDEGRVVEMGSHQELLNEKGYYYSVYKKQQNF